MKLYGLSTAAVVAAVAVMAGCGGGSSKLDTKQVFSLAQPSTVELTGKNGKQTVGGTGVIIDASRGLILTNAHVVQGVTSLQAKVNDQSTVPAQIVGVAPCDDVAVVKLATPQPGLKAIKIGSSASVHNQDEVTALGYPASLNADPNQEKVVSTNGTVQSPNVPADLGKSSPKYPSTIQHSATLNHGNSGGPLLNNKGELIGINTLTNTGDQQQQVQGQYYAISIDHIKSLLPQLTAGHNIANVGWNIESLGQVLPQLPVLFKLTGFTLPGYSPQVLAKAARKILAKKQIDGVFVLGTDPGSPAQKKKIGFGDIVTGVNGTPVTSVADACGVLQSASPGQTLKVQGAYLTSGGIQRFGQSWAVNVTVAQ